MSDEEGMRTLIARIIDVSGLTDPRKIAALVADEIPEDLKHRVLVDALVANVRGMLGRQRNEAVTNALRPRSAKVIGIRDWWAEMLASAVHVGDSTWKPLGECNDADLAYAEAERRQDAARELARADQFARLREMLAEHGVRTVREIPRETAEAAR
jgi:hypothetical protein